MRVRDVSCLTVIAFGFGAAALSVPGSADPPRSDRSEPADCASCHAEVAREWRSSLHRQSFSDPLFQAGYRVDHRAFCRDCHAPRSEGADPRPGTAAYDDGITCTECHTPRARRAHPSSQPAGDFGERACGGCHQFQFPQQSSLAAVDPSAWMQRTVDEWRESGVTEACADCHMPHASHASHAFTVDASRIAGAIAIEGELVAHPGSTEVVLRLSAVRAGHAVPTGDVLRTLELSVWPADSPGRVQRRELTRVFGTSLRFDRAAGITARTVEREDTRIPPRGERVERFSFEEETAEVRYRLDYLHVNRRQAALQGVRDGENRLVVAQGALNAPRGTRRESARPAPSLRPHASRPRASHRAPR